MAISSLSSENTSPTMSPSTFNSEPLRSTIFNSPLLTKIETFTILRGDKRALGTISTSRTLYDVITSMSVSDLRQHDKLVLSDEPPLKRRYQRRNSQTAFILSLLRSRPLLPTTKNPRHPLRKNLLARWGIEDLLHILYKQTVY